MSQGGAASRSQKPALLMLGGAVVAALAISGAGGEAQAQAQQIVRPLLGNQPNDLRFGPTVRYATPDGRIRFVFDRSGAHAAFLRFEGDPEVHVLRSVGAAGGGELYRNEAGDIALRVTPHGGVTLYTRVYRTGAPAAEEGAAEPLIPAVVQVAQYQRRMLQLANLASRELGRPIEIQAPREATGVQAGLVIDAAERAIASLMSAPRGGGGVVRIAIRLAPAPAARRRGEQLDIAVAPPLGYEGRPSTYAINNVLAGPEQ